MSKTVYIIGAGFSADAGAPLQRDLVGRVFSLDIADLPRPEALYFDECRIAFRQFLENDLCIAEDCFSSVTLENVYTPLDRCIIDNVALRGRSGIELFALRQQISACLVFLIRHSMRAPTDAEYVRRFAQHLLSVRSGARIGGDPLAVLSLNWDIALDNALQRAIDPAHGVIDYCCYVNAYNTDAPVPPGLLARGLGMYNFKLLKLHGSMNWLQCRRCQRLFVAFFEKIAAHEFLSKPRCNFCMRNHHHTHEHMGGAPLHSQLIMPTFLKDLNNVQLKLIWQNAGIELSEADRVVFLGYSFPEADFELRQLLVRFVRQDAKIEVVLKQQPKDGCMSAEEARYRAFFGRRELCYFDDGVQNYIMRMCDQGL